MFERLVRADEIFFDSGIVGNMKRWGGSETGMWYIRQPINDPPIVRQDDEAAGGSVERQDGKNILQRQVTGGSFELYAGRFVEGVVDVGGEGHSGGVFISITVIAGAILSCVCITP